MDPLRLDGGLATTLQQTGLPPFHPVEPWLWEHPERIVSAHRAFVDAGAQLVLTATFLAHTTEDPVRTARRAIDLAREAADTVWLSVGPGSGPRDWIEHVLPEVDGVVLETFLEPDDAIDVLGAWTREVPTVVSFAPVREHPWDEVADRVLSAGACGFGFNCVDGSRLVRLATGLSRHIPLWAKPNGGPGFAPAYRALQDRATWLGGCCGVGPSDLLSLRSAD